MGTLRWEEQAQEGGWARVVTYLGVVKAIIIIVIIILLLHSQQLMNIIANGDLRPKRISVCGINTDERIGISNSGNRGLCPTRPR